MKVAVVAVLCSVLGANALVVERDGKTVQKVIANVQTSVDSLDSAVNKYTGSDIKPVNTSATSLQSTIKSGTATVQKTSALTQSEAIDLVSPVDELKKHAQTLVKDLKAKKATIASKKQCDLTRKQISGIKTNSDALIKAIVAKVPSNLQSTAKSEAQGISDALADAQTSFNTTNCVNAK